MTKANRALRFIFFSVWAVLMTALTYILGAVTLKVLRHKLGRLGYWTLSTVISCGLLALQAQVLAVAFFSLVVLMGVFAELEEMGLSLKVSAFFTLVINALLAAGAFALWVFYTGPKWSQQVLSRIENLLQPLTELNPQLQLNYFDLMLQLPSIVIILWMGAIYTALLLEKRLLNGGAPATSAAMREQLAEFRLPDAIVWMFIVALLGAFGGIPYQWVEALSVNAVNVIVVLFFFQGIAVVARLFESLRMGLFWQFLFMVLIVVHLFLFVSLVGLMDYWLDFRNRMSKKRTEEFNREV